jgi:hypothetical protein
MRASSFRGICDSSVSRCFRFRLGEGDNLAKQGVAASSKAPPVDGSTGTSSNIA